MQDSHIGTSFSSDIATLHREVGRLTIQRTFQKAKHQKEKAELKEELDRLAFTLINMSSTLNELLRNCNQTGTVEPKSSSVFTQFSEHHQE
jgi:hypothetical protein